MSVKISKTIILAILSCFMAIPWINAADSRESILATRAADTGATKVVAAINPKTDSLTDTRTGDTAVLPDVDGLTQVPGGALFWQVTNEKNDRLGFTHLDFEQRIFLNETDAARLPEPYGIEGIPVIGGLLNFHYDKEGALYFVSGAFYEDAEIPADLRVETRMDAISSTWDAMDQLDEYDVLDLGSIVDDSAILDELLELVELKLASSGDGKSLSYIWTVPVPLAEGTPLMAALDGTDASLLYFWDPNPNSLPSSCMPIPGNPKAAVADPQNPNVQNRSGLAGTYTTFFSGYSYYAAWPESSLIPGVPDAPVTIKGYRGTTSDTCSMTFFTELYEALPLSVSGLLPFYGNGTDQKIGGDAVWKTYQTMEFFEELDWDGYDDQGSIADVVIDAGGSCPVGNSTFYHTIFGGVILGPLDSVVICPQHQTDQNYSSAASLDVVAHEWGHGVIYENAWDYDTQLHKQLHEGWADIIGHAAEWRQETVPSQYLEAETEDWHFDEDSGRTDGRRVNLDDGHYSGGQGLYSYHASDPCYSGYGHYCGMRLPVAYWLVANGETDDGLFENVNPVCRRNPDPTWADCTLQVSPLGDWDATQIFFRTLTIYVNSGDDWNDFAEYAKQSALDLFGTTNGCYNADDEQDSVQDAFTAIGYPGPTPTNRYCLPGCCP